METINAIAEIKEQFWKKVLLHWPDRGSFTSHLHPGTHGLSYLYGGAAVKAKGFGLPIFQIDFQNIWHKKKWIVFNCFLFNNKGGGSAGQSN